MRRNIPWHTLGLAVLILGASACPEALDGADALGEVGPECATDGDCPSPAPCQAGLCEAGSCRLQPNEGGTCDDADPCTIGDVCDALGKCTAGLPVSCPNSEDTPCLRAACDAAEGLRENDFCVLIADDQGIPEEDRCHTYACEEGEAKIASDKADCAALEIPTHGCVETYQCDPDFYGLDDSPCKPVNQPNGTSCLDSQGQRILPAQAGASAGSPSVCGANVCYVPDAEHASECVDSRSLKPGVQATLKEALEELETTCTVEALSAGEPACNELRCLCAGGDCSATAKGSCALWPTHDDGESCDTGNPCELATCQADETGELGCVVDGLLDCDQYPDTTCDTWLPCNPEAGGCPLVMLESASHEKCREVNSCIVAEQTFCTPGEVGADPETGCNTKYKPLGEPCTLGVVNECVNDARCLPVNDNELACLVTGYLCQPSSDCQILTGCETGCQYIQLTGVFCEDDAACTDQAFCAEGICLGEEVPGACDDDDPCTIDSCSLAIQGCTHESIPGCANSLCQLSGEAGDLVTCKVHLLREDASTPYAVGGRLVFEYEPSSIGVQGIRLNACGPDECTLSELVAQQPEGPIPPHSIASHPALAADWNGHGVLFVIPGTNLPPLSVNVSAGTPKKGKHTLEFDLKLLVAHSDDEVFPFGLVSARLSSATGSVLVGVPLKDRVELCEQATCPVDSCGDEPVPDGCGGQIQCPCDTPCAYNGCEKNAVLGPAKRPAHSGDFNDDGSVNFTDASLYRARVWATLSGEGPGLEQAFPDGCVDLNCDGLIDPFDLTRATLLAIAEFQANWSTLANDSDDDGIHDRCDDDDDNDGAIDSCEWASGTDPFSDASVPVSECEGQGCKVPSQACSNGADLTVFMEWNEDLEKHCVSACDEGPNFPECLQVCLRDAAGLSSNCAYCRVERKVCQGLQCADACAISDDECNDCISEECSAAYGLCTGFELKCEDDTDNNGDGLVDCEDPSCMVQSTCLVAPTPGPCDGTITNQEDLEAKTVGSLTCAQSCQPSESFGACLETCLVLIVGVLGACMDCFYVLGACSLEQCDAECEDPESAGCESCLGEACGESFKECAKIEVPKVGACDNPSDSSVNFIEGAMVAQSCAENCKWLPMNPSCVPDCVIENTGLSAGCVSCYTNLLTCGELICGAECAEGFEPECGQCVLFFCGPGFETCSGTPTGTPFDP